MRRLGRLRHHVPCVAASSSTAAKRLGERSLCQRCCSCVLHCALLFWPRRLSVWRVYFFFGDAFGFLAIAFFGFAAVFGFLAACRFEHVRRVAGPSSEPGGRG